jgi:hypothetical protein
MACSQQESWKVSCDQISYMTGEQVRAVVAGTRRWPGSKREGRQCRIEPERDGRARLAPPAREPGCVPPGDMPGARRFGRARARSVEPINVVRQPELSAYID